MENELMPCPFCGGTPKVQTDGESSYWIECTNAACGSSTNMRIALMDDVTGALAEQWNRRATPATSAQGGEAAKASVVMCDVETIRDIARELETEAEGYVSDLADTMNGCAAVLRILADEAQAGAQRTADYEAVLAGHRKLVRELDVLLNGEEGAAKQARLADIVSQVRREGIRAAAPASAQQGDGVRTDLSVRLRETASDPMWHDHVEVSKALILKAADEIERYYGGMLNWKRTAEAKDAKLARAATTVPASDSIDTPEFRKLLNAAYAHRGADGGKEATDNLIAHINAWHAAGVEKARAVPEGWKAVPIEPTVAMLDAGENARKSEARPWAAFAMYAAMLAAAPSPAAAKEGGVA